MIPKTLLFVPFTILRHFTNVIILFYHAQGRSPSVWTVVTHDLALDLAVGVGSGRLAGVLRSIVEIGDDGWIGICTYLGDPVDA